MFEFRELQMLYLPRLWEFFGSLSMKTLRLFLENSPKLSQIMFILTILDASEQGKFRYFVVLCQITLSVLVQVL